MTESSDKSAEMMKFNDEQRDADMQRRISERTPVETDLLDDADCARGGDSCSSTASTCQPPRWRSTCKRCSPPQRLPTTRRAPPRLDSTNRRPAHPETWVGGASSCVV